MRDAPEIAPEIRGLLEELVADPRSSIRLVPRRPLRYWFDSDETIRPREISGTKLERHLVEVHREELAQLLQAAAQISYWKAPVLTYRPIGADGQPYDPSDRESTWCAEARRFLGSGGAEGDSDSLLRAIGGIAPGDGAALAIASLSLVPSDRTRCYLALATPWEKPRTSIRLFRQVLARTRHPDMRSRILASLGWRLCSLERLGEAREAYRAASEHSIPSAVCAFNLSCFLGDEAAAVEDMGRLPRTLSVDTPEIVETIRVLRAWLSSRTPNQLNGASKTALRVSHVIPGALAQLLEAYSS